MYPRTSKGLLLLLLWALACCGKESNTRYILYDVNPGEGFNLRRDVFVRMATFVKKLNQAGQGKFVLVLPPWGRLYHWQSRELGAQIKIPWRTFFDVDSINRYVPVMELEDFIEQESPIVDSVLYLQNYKEGWTDGKWEERHDFRDCLDPPRYRKPIGGDEYFYGWFWEYDQMRARSFRCLSVQGTTASAHDLVLAETDGVRSLMLDRAEQLLHDWFGDQEYWRARRSARFARHLVEIGDEFRRKELASEDEADDTVLPARWEGHQPARRPDRGGPYLCLHLRRKDYVHARKDQIPSVAFAAEQIRRKLDALGLKVVFVATDAPRSEYEQFADLLGDDFRVTKYEPDAEMFQKYKDGGVAIIDQNICSHARHFIGSAESTFTFRIQEEREIMGFTADSTFDMLCPDGKFDCTKGSVWKIVYPEEEEKQQTTIEHEEL